MPGSRISAHLRFLVIVVSISYQLLVLPTVAKAYPRIIDIRHWSGPASTRVIVDLSGEARFQTSLLSQPPRLVTEIHGTWSSGGTEMKAAGSRLVDRIRLKKKSSRVAQLVLDLKDSELNYDVFLIKPMKNQSFRLVIDLESPKLVRMMREKRRDVQTSKRSTTRVVVIDPGHGGEDPGAIGPKGAREKNVVLSIAKTLQKRLALQPGMEVYLTRTGDYFISLRKRIEIAQDYGADLFLSIHTDGSRFRGPRGASVYCLSSDGATDEAARILAEKENAADLAAGIRLDDDQTVSAILLDLVQTHTIDESLHMGSVILGELRQVNRLKFTKPRQAGFRVLRAPDIPSVLIEVGFITNPNEEKLLQKPSFHGTVALALENSVRRFFCETRPLDSRQVAQGFCEQLQSKVHIVKPGQNLSNIASLYRTSVREIQRANSIKNASRIFPGQKIRIP
jgi:N-acetylmuramoyl-L-alanine amidase